MGGFVVCPACGTRIKAGRPYCLRCFAALPDADARPPIWESLGLSRGHEATFAIIASLIVLALVGVIWSTWPGRPDDEAHPVASQNKAAAPAAAPAPAATPEGTDTAPAAQADEIAGGRTGELTAEARASLEGARVAYEQALTKTPDNPEVLNNLGRTLAQLNRPDEALPRFERAVALAPDTASYHASLARTAAALGQGSRATEQFREAARLLPEDFATRYTLAMALQRNGDHEAALPEFERAIALAPADASPHRAYAISLEQLGRTPDAVREYRRYLEMRPSAPDAPRLRAHLEALASAQP
ncbi:MAG TPA: tetratricopeptide repeat protein [Vicinamibacterales bacterium]|nr:tetratricopeptide repeat protein [Vicinamibacterales bacterium]